MANTSPDALTGDRSDRIQAAASSTSKNERIHKVPARLPTSVKALKGTLRKCRVKNEPKPPDGIPSPPATLSAEALSIWNELAPICRELGTLTVADVKALARLCEMHVQWRKCLDVIDRDGFTYELEGKNGGVCIMQRPEVSIANRLAVQIRAIESDFGLSAVARGKIDLPKSAVKKPGITARKR